MTKATPEVERLAAQRLAADEDRLDRSTGPGSSETGPSRRRQSITLGAAWREFWRHPSPPMISAFLLGSVVARVLAGPGSWWELAIPAALVALFPLVEWVIHVGILHWRPRSVGPVRVDSRLARDHRAHHADPRDLPLVFIPWRALAWLLPAYVVVAWLVMPTTASALSLLVSVYAIKLGYEWTHYLVHSDYRPRSRWYRSVWRNHRLHHYKNEHYWFTVTTAGTADRLLGTCPDPATVETSPTVRRLHETESGRQAS
jgi:sterol desaturase/sphingolipid hydroxylase (fatty acid hydroxylase superfamily)